jgi:hypothetical protein
MAAVMAVAVEVAVGLRRGVQPPAWAATTSVAETRTRCSRQYISVLMAAIRDVRRFTALDMRGRAGSLRRRRFIRAEFVLSCVVALALAAFLLANGAWLIGFWVLGIGVNYIPLAMYSVVLFPGHHVERELAGVDLPTEARRAGVAQFGLLVPFLVAIVAAVQFARRDQP